MNTPSSTSNIGTLLVAIIVITITYSYIPREMNLIREILALIQFGLMLGVGIITLRSVLREF